MTTRPSDRHYYRRKEDKDEMIHKLMIEALQMKAARHNSGVPNSGILKLETDLCKLMQF